MVNPLVLTKTLIGDQLKIAIDEYTKQDSSKQIFTISKDILS